MFIPKVPYPSYDLTFIVTSDKYYFFSKNCHYLIDGQPTGKSLMVKFRDYSSPVGPALLTNGTMFLVEPNDLLNAIKAGKKSQIKLLFDNQLPITVQVDESILKDWQEVVKSER
jgi:hypothetical protein